ncbi:MAG: cytidylyltransferase domain-containing protein [Ignavibacteriales bacterium]
MYNNQTILGIIPARGGSKGVPGKNILDLAGRPLIAWTIEEAKKSAYIDRLILSSEDQGIIKIAEKYSCEVPFIRPVELAQDDTPGIDPVIHAIEFLPEKYDYVVLLQPTSPLRTVADIDGCIEHCINLGSATCVSLSEADSPYWMYHMINEFTIEPIMKDHMKYSRRQDLPKTYQLNGAIYIAKIEVLEIVRSFITETTIGYVMPHERSVDIDNLLDFKICELLLNNN